MRKTKNLPIYSSWVVEFSQNHEEKLVRNCEKFAEYFCELDRLLPEKYGWRYSSVDCLSEQLRATKGDTKAAQSLINKDLARNIEAYSLTTYWRSAELLNESVRCLNLKEVLPAAIIARSLLELTCAYFINAHDIKANIDQLCSNLKEEVVVSIQDFSEFMQKMFWRTRVGDPCEELKQKNILSYINRISKHHDHARVPEIYDFLCDIAHPNLIGNAKFLSRSQHINDDGSEVLALNRNDLGDISDEILETLVWSLSWSSGCLRTAFELMWNSTRRLI